MRTTPLTVTASAQIKADIIDIGPIAVSSDSIRLTLRWPIQTGGILALTEVTREGQLREALQTTETAPGASCMTIKADYTLTPIMLNG